MKTYNSPLDLADSMVNPFDTKLIKGRDDDINDRFDGARLVNMTADDYFKLVANDVNLRWQDLEDQRRSVPNKISVDDIAKKMRAGEKFPTPWVHLHHKLGTIPHFQEGLHRMLAAKDVYGDKQQFPVWLGYNEEEKWEDIEDALANGKIDDWIQKRNAKIRQNQIDYDNAEYEKELKRKEEDKKDAALWFKLNGIEDVDDATLERYYREMDDLFQDED